MDNGGVSTSTPELEPDPFDLLPPAALLLGCAAAEPPAALLEGLRAVLPDRPVEVVPLAGIRARVEELVTTRPVVVVPYLLSSHDEGGAEMRAATAGVGGAITTSALGPHPVLSGILGDAARRAGLPADGGIVLVAVPPVGSDVTAQEADVDDEAYELFEANISGRRDLAQTVYDLDSVWVGPVAAALAGAEPDVQSTVRRMAADGRDVAVVTHSLTPIVLDAERLPLAGARLLVTPGWDERQVGVVVDRYEQGVAELRAGLDEDAWSAPLV